ncbi:hypothetical protein JCM3766R1_005586 [Sporobolomyces carnicolor]
MADYDGPPPSKASLLKWWKMFTSKDKDKDRSKQQQQQQQQALAHSSSSTSRRMQPPPGSPSYIPPGRGLERGKDGNGRVFGVSLEQSLQYASVAISMVGQDGKQYVYGYVPIVVAKCGMMLKETATHTEGIFRVSGSNKRINQLQVVFDEPPRYGKDFDWTGYSVHDAASVLRRYLNSLPEPVIPAGLYLDFTAVLQRPQPIDDSIAAYRHLISLLPPASRYLLLYLLDFLSVFARCSSKNLMTASNLAVVFQPGLVSSRREGTNSALLGFPGFVEGRLPTSPGSVTGRSNPGAQEQAGEHGRGKEVLEFLIEQQASFMIGLEAPVDAERQKNKGVGPTPAPVAAVLPPAAQAIPTSSPTPITGETETYLLKGSTDLVRRGSDKSIERRRLRKSTDAGKEGTKVKRSRTWGSSSKRKARNERGESRSASPQAPTVTSFVPPANYQRPSVAAIPPSLSPPSQVDANRLYPSPHPSASRSPASTSASPLATSSSAAKKPRKSTDSTRTPPVAQQPPVTSRSSLPAATLPSPAPVPITTVPASVPLASTIQAVPIAKPPNKTASAGSVPDTDGREATVELEGPRWATRVKKTAAASPPPPQPESTTSAKR